MRCVGLLLLALLALAVVARAAAPPKAHPRPEDIPFIKCQVCSNVHKGTPSRHRASVPGTLLLPVPGQANVASAPPLAAAQVCELLAKQAWRQVREMMGKAATPSDKASRDRSSTCGPPPCPWTAADGCPPAPNP